MKVLITFSRIFVGCLFIFSGFIKANDPLGFSYKLDEYFEIFHMPFLIPLTVYMAMGICVLEIALGVILLLGEFMEFTAWMLLGLIVFFTFLTGYSAVTGAVSDCGCFGDFLHLTPWTSFTKDIVLLVFILVIFIYRKRISPIFSLKWSWFHVSMAVLIPTLFTVICYNYLPVIDFRAYKIGNNLREQMTLAPGAKRDSMVLKLVYKDKTTNEEKGYLMNELPYTDSVWMANHEFVKQDKQIIVEGDKPKITDFKVWSEESPDITAEILDDPTYHLWIVSYDLTKADKGAFDKIVKLANDCDAHGVKTIALTSTDYEFTDPFRHEVNAAFPFYYCDGTVLKTMIRSNPGIMLMKGSTVRGMWHYHSTPSFENLNKKFFSK